MSDEQNPIPELNARPMHLLADDLARAQQRYIRHVRAEVEEFSGSGSFERFVACVRYFESLKRLSIDDCMKRVLGNSSEWTTYRATVDALASGTKQAPVAVIDLSADFQQIAAQVGDFALRVSRTADADVAKFLHTRALEQLEFVELEDARNGYQAAYTLYGRCFLETIVEIRKARANPTDPRHVMGPILDQLATKHIWMATRLMLLRIAESMEAKDPALRLEIPSGDLVLPHLPRFPEARRSVARDIEESTTRRVIESTMSIILNSPESIVNVYGNIGLYATILGDYRHARQAVSIATTFARGMVPEELRRLALLIDLMDPAAAA